ncbi:MAG: hypothetical protein ACOCXT_04770 [Candidatus Dojkabacteria bacterium]
MGEHLKMLFAITGLFVITGVLSSLLGKWLEGKGWLPEGIGFLIPMAISWLISWGILFLYLKRRKVL